MSSWLQNVAYAEIKVKICKKFTTMLIEYKLMYIKQLLDEVEHDIMNDQNWGQCYLPKPKAEADNTDTRFW